VPAAARGRPLLAVRRAWVLPALAGAGALVLAGAGTVAAVETDTVDGYWHGLWWCLSLMTTVGFIDQPPRTGAGAALSAVLMVAGFLLLALVSAALASLFVREDEEPMQRREQAATDQILAELQALRAEVATLRADGPAGRAGSDGGGPASVPF